MADKDKHSNPAVPASPGRHISRAFDKDMDRVDSLLSEMRALVSERLHRVVAALSGMDTAAAGDLVDTDSAVNDLEATVAERATRLLALRQPVAFDLRFAIGAIREAIVIETIGDLVKHIAGRIVKMRESGIGGGETEIDALRTFGQDLAAMYDSMAEAAAKRDVARAIEIWRDDKQIDKIHEDLIKNFYTRIGEKETSGNSHSALVHDLFLASAFERIGDKVKDMAEILHYVVTGVPLEEDA